MKKKLLDKICRFVACGAIVLAATIVSEAMAHPRSVSLKLADGQEVLLSMEDLQVTFEKFYDWNMLVFHSPDRKVEVWAIDVADWQHSDKEAPKVEKDPPQEENPPMVDPPQEEEGPVVGVSAVGDASQLNIRVEQNAVHLSGLNPGVPVKIFTLQGVCLVSIMPDVENKAIVPLAHGAGPIVLTANGKSVIIR